MRELNLPLDAVEKSDREEGFTILEIMLALTITIVSASALCGSLLTMGQQREENSTRLAVFSRVKSVMEEIIGANPESVYSTYHGKVEKMQIGVVSGYDAEITITVDDTDPFLMPVTVTGTWDGDQTVFLITEIFSPQE